MQWHIRRPRQKPGGAGQGIVQFILKITDYVTQIIHQFSNSDTAAWRISSAQVTHQVQHLRCRQHGVEDRPLGRASQDLGKVEDFSRSFYSSWLDSWETLVTLLKYNLIVCKVFEQYCNQVIDSW